MDGSEDGMEDLKQPMKSYDFDDECADGQRSDLDNKSGYDNSHDGDEAENLQKRYILPLLSDKEKSPTKSIHKNDCITGIPIQIFSNIYLEFNIYKYFIFSDFPSFP